MRYLTFLMIAGFTLFAGCTPGQEMSGGETNGQWETTLIPEAGFTGLGGEVEITTLEWGATATVRIEGSQEAGSYGWFIRQGECGDDGEIVGSRETYPPLEVASDGSGEATAMVDEQLQSGERYYVSVHPSPEETSTIVACGDLLSTGQPATDVGEEWDG